MNRKPCKECKYWTALVNTPDSFGTCSWNEHHPIPVMPSWMTVKTQHGSISPNMANCRVWEENDQAQD